jgi:hypothetical protein
MVAAVNVGPEFATRPIHHNRRLSAAPGCRKAVTRVAQGREPSQPSTGVVYAAHSGPYGGQQTGRADTQVSRFGRDAPPGVASRCVSSDNPTRYQFG